MLVVDIGVFLPGAAGTQIVFIGTKLDQAEIEDKCSRALLTPDELSGKRPILGDGEHTPIKYLIAEGWKAAEAAGDAYGTFRLNFHRFDRFELDLRGYTQP